MDGLGCLAVVIAGLCLMGFFLWDSNETGRE